MNKERKGRFNDVISSLEEAKGELEDILNEEQDSYDSLPDGLQMSSRGEKMQDYICLLYTSPSPRDISGSRMPSSA